MVELLVMSVEGTRGAVAAAVNPLIVACFELVTLVVVVRIAVELVGYFVQKPLVRTGFRYRLSCVVFRLHFRQGIN